MAALVRLDVEARREIGGDRRGESKVEQDEPARLARDGGDEEDGDRGDVEGDEAVAEPAGARAGAEIELAQRRVERQFPASGNRRGRGRRWIVAHPGLTFSGGSNSLGSQDRDLPL